MDNKSVECCILGSGPAGLATGLELIKNGINDIIIIDKNDIVGGLARTVLFNETRFDVGPHRFFTKNKEINRLWHNTLGKDFIEVNRLTRIMYNKKLFNYPISAFDALSKLGLSNSTHALLSYLNTFLKSKNNITTFEDWISANFGKKLYETFFKTYTEKVWGIPCNEIGKEFAEQRIKGLNILEVIKNTFYKSNKPKTLIDKFNYPILGAGQMYEAWADKITSSGGNIILGSEVVNINQKDDLIESIEIISKDKKKLIINASQFFSSIPITHFFKLLNPQPKKRISIANSNLYYREHITVNLVISQTGIFPDQWMYIHEPSVKMARIANYNNFSETMIPNKRTTAISVEYFTFQNDKIWSMKNDDLVNLAINELVDTKIIDKLSIIEGSVIRETESYPTYYLGYKEHYNILKDEIDKFKNLATIGRGGMYKYNNQDHSTYSGLLAARNYLKIGKTKYNLWNINTEAEYHESYNNKTD